MFCIPNKLNKLQHAMKAIFFINYVYCVHKCTYIIGNQSLSRPTIRLFYLIFEMLIQKLKKSSLIPQNTKQSIPEQNFYNINHFRWTQWNCFSFPNVQVCSAVICSIVSQPEYQ